VIDGVGDEDDEFATLSENAEDAGLVWRGQAEPRRDFVTVSGRAISAIVWGREPEVVLLHGGAQNAHTWDTTVLALDRSILALDLPGHGWSGWWEDGIYPPSEVVDVVAGAIAQLAPRAEAIAGTGLGASIGLAIAPQRADATKKVVVIDSAPGGSDPQSDVAEVQASAAAAVSAFTAQQKFASFDALVEHALLHHPHRNERALRRGLRHNAVADANGIWRWRWDPALRGAPPVNRVAGDAALEAFVGDLLVVRGEHSDIVDDEKVARMRARLPTLSVVTIAGAGHSVQSDQPVELARVLGAFLDGEDVERA
jgi:pimeloyl-ACP methyl ester carboxylesterase